MRLRQYKVAYTVSLLVVSVATKEYSIANLIISLAIFLAAIAAVIAIIFGLITVVRKRSALAGALVFFWSFFGGLLGSVAGFFTGGLWHYWTVRSDPAFSNPDLNGLSYGFQAMYLINVWLFFCIVGAILGSILGGVYGLKFYRTRNRRN